MTTIQIVLAVIGYLLSTGVAAYILVNCTEDSDNALVGLIWPLLLILTCLLGPIFIAIYLNDRNQLKKKAEKRKRDELSELNITIERLERGNRRLQDEIEEAARKFHDSIVLLRKTSKGKKK